jgi:hypothetical protein
MKRRYFVRRDCVGGIFCLPFTAENHYQPARYFVSGTYVSGGGSQRFSAVSLLAPQDVVYDLELSGPR